MLSTLDAGHKRQIGSEYAGIADELNAARRVVE